VPRFEFDPKDPSALIEKIDLLESFR